MYAVVSGSREGPSQILRKLLLAISVCSAAIPSTFAKSLTEALSAVRGHFPSNDGSDNFCYYSCDCIDLSLVSPAVIYLVCLYSVKKRFHYGTRSVQLSEKYLAVRVMVSDNGWVTLLTVILSHNWSLSQRGAIQPLSVFIALNSPWSIELFTALPGCCPLRRTPFLNVVRMRTRSLVPKPRTTVIDLGARQLDTWNRGLTRAAAVLSVCLFPYSSGQGLWRVHHLGKLLTYSYLRSFSKARVVSCLSKLTVVCCPVRERKSGNQLHEGR